jgi:hypothetical protein
MIDRKLREFWLTWEHIGGEPLIVANEKSPLASNTFMHVRQVSPELDAAWAECERALEQVTIFHHLTGENCNCDQCNALAALKKARGEK